METLAGQRVSNRHPNCRRIRLAFILVASIVIRMALKSAIRLGAVMFSCGIVDFGPHLPTTTRKNRHKPSNNRRDLGMKRTSFVCLVIFQAFAIQRGIAQVGPTDFEVSGERILSAPLDIEVDNLVFHEGSTLVTGGFPVNIKVRAELRIDSDARITGLIDSQKLRCLMPSAGKPIKAPNGYSYQPGPDAPDKAPLGSPGQHGGDGATGAAPGLTITCAPMSPGDVTIHVAGNAKGRLTVDLSGANGVTGNPSGDGGNGGRGQQGGTCSKDALGPLPGGVWPGGLGGNGASGGWLAPSEERSGNGGSFELLIEGNSDEFRLARVDTGPGEYGRPGVPGNGGKLGQGGNWGRGGTGCGLPGGNSGSVPGKDGYSGLMGGIPFRSLGKLGSPGRIVVRGTDYFPPDTEPEEIHQLSEDANWEATKEFWSWLAPTIMGIKPIVVEAISGGPDSSLIIPAASLEALWGHSVDPFEGPLAKAIYENILHPRLVPNPDPLCRASPNAFACCDTRQPDGRPTQSVFFGCLPAASQYRNIPSKGFWFTYGVLSERVLARELSRVAILMPRTDAFSGKLPGKQVYLEIQNSKAGRNGKNAIWPSNLSLFLPLDGALFEKISVLLSNAIAGVGVGLSVPADGLATFTVNSGLYCSQNVVRPILIANEDSNHPGDQTYKPQEGFSTLRITSGAKHTFIAPNGTITSDFVALRVWSFRGSSVYRLQYDFTGPDANNSNHLYSFLTSMAVRKDSFPSCLDKSMEGMLQNVPLDYLKISDIQTIVFNILYQKTAASYLAWLTSLPR